MNTNTKQKIESVINVFESGSLQGDYSLVSIYADGVGNSKQITFGRSQTTEQGNLKQLLEMYCSNTDAKYAHLLKPYLSKITGKKTISVRRAER